jgi:hypothetical protein
MTRSKSEIAVRPLDHNPIRLNRIVIRSLLLEHDLRANAFRVCREGKPVPTLGSSPRACFSGSRSNRRIPYVTAFQGARRSEDRLQWRTSPLVRDGVTQAPIGRSTIDECTASGGERYASPGKHRTDSRRNNYYDPTPSPDIAHRYRSCNRPRGFRSRHP